MIYPITKHCLSKTNMEKLITINRCKVLNSLFIALFFGLILQSCSSGDGSPKFKDFEEIEVRETNQGVISEIDEIEPGDTYTVIKEEVIDKKADSKAIVHNLNGSTDTLSFAKMNESGQSTRSGLRPFLMGTLAASFFSRNMGASTLNPSNYKSTDAFNKSKGMRSSMLSSASTRKVKVPGKKSKGYGQSKSFRSFGG